jgi:hypothetical protein
MKRAILLWCSLVMCVAAVARANAAGRPVPVVRVTATVQPYDFLRPWSKKSPHTWRALGAVLSGRRVLVTGEFVADATYIELEKARSGEKIAAKVECVDYDANLALLRPVEEKFLDGLKALEVKPALVGDRLSILQLEPSGELLPTAATMTAAEVVRYPMETINLMAYRLSSSLQIRDGSITLPVAKDGRLAGLLMRYESRTQTAEAVPAPVVEHFLKAAARKEYRGFPRAGIAFAAMRDPQLRRYAGLTEKQPGGVYVTEVLKGRPADRAGLRVGDVVLAIGGFAIDADGNYDDPLYGKIALTHLLSTRYHDGDVAPFKLFREGRTWQADVTMKQLRVEDNVVEPYTFDRPPRYHVLGGLILLELSRQYLREWGAKWLSDAPLRFVYADRYQTDLFQDGRKKLVILHQVLPSPSAIGYENLRYRTVTRINDVTLNSFDDVAAAVARPAGGFHKIESKEDPKTIYLDARQVAADEATLMKTYGLPAIRR